MAGEQTFEEIDFEDFDPESGGKPDDMAGGIAGFFVSLNYKMLIALFLIFIFLTSDIYIEKILNRIPGAVDHREATTKGAFIQALMMVIFYILVDLVLKTGLI